MSKKVSPVGESVADYLKRRGDSDELRRAQADLGPFEQIARLVIMRRAELGLTQRDLAERMGTTASVISRIEGGQHKTSAETIRRLAQALEGSAVVGFDFGTPAQPRPMLVTL